MKVEKGDPSPASAGGLEGQTGADGPKGDKGDSELTGAFYATAFYQRGQHQRRGHRHRGVQRQPREDQLHRHLRWRAGARPR